MKNRDIAGMATMLMAASLGCYEPTQFRTDPTIELGRHKKPQTRQDIADYALHHKIADSRQLREFSIKGHKVMAYSRKDAITRLKHQKKI